MPRWDKRLVTRDVEGPDSYLCADQLSSFGNSFNLGLSSQNSFLGPQNPRSETPMITQALLFQGFGPGKKAVLTLRPHRERLCLASKH